MPLTETFIRQLHHTLLREDYIVYTSLPGGLQSSYVVHAGSYKTRPNSVITHYGDRIEYASPEETPALMNDLVNWYNEAEKVASTRQSNLPRCSIIDIFVFTHLKMGMDVLHV